MTLSPPAAPSRSSARTALPQRTTTVGTVATAGQRAAAYLIDVAVVAVLAAIVWFTTGSLVLVSVTVIELWAIGWIWEGHTGATPGNLIFGIRTVQKNANVSVGARGLFPRSLAVGVAHIIPILLPIGLLASGLLDGLARSRVVDIRKTRQSAPNEIGHALDLEARVTGAESQTMTADGAPGVITHTPLTPPPAADQAPLAAPAVNVDAGPIPVFELSDGTVIQATGFGYIGRAPRAPESIADAILIRVSDSTRSLSRTHASFGVEDGQLWAQDLGSANGASVRHLHGGVSALAPHVPTFLTPGDVLVLGGEAELAFRRVALPGARSAPASPAQKVQDAAQAVAARLGANTPPSPTAPEQVSAPASAPAPTPTPVPVATPASVPMPALTLLFSDGSAVPVRGLGYIGRAPRLPEGEHPEAALISVPNGDRSVSRTHGRFGIVDGQAWFEDLGSGNGSALQTTDGRSGPMTPHQRFILAPGMVLQLGDCVIRVINA